MSVTSGFFNSRNGDRKYNAEEMSAIFDGVINDGVFASIGNGFAVSASSGNNINIGIGRAWFNSTWIYNDAVLPLTAENSEVLLDRYDAVVFNIDHSDAVRAATIKIIKGVPGSSPKYPTMANTEYLKQYPICYILRKAGSSEITQAEIKNMIGTSSCPYVTSILQTTNIDNVVAQWEEQWVQWKNQESNKYESWISDMKGALKEEAATALAAEIANLKLYREVTFLASGWSSNAPYTQTITLLGMEDTDRPIPIFVDNGVSSSDSKNRKKSYSYITKFDSGNGTLTATCKYKRPESDCTIALKGV